MKWHHAGIQVRHLADAIQFYESMFDFKVEKYLTLPGEKIAFLKKEEVRIELIESGEILVPSSSIHLSWGVEDLEVLKESLIEKGLNPSEGPYKLENGWITVFYEGLNNEVIEIIQ
ncbi:glyoxalase/bleomycin resistance/dioxygenase family protein [Cytobacillus depressus]|uniref:Glyoxalase/bleomycin resistance/dioxygenase family protein n=1 Tax=Cytobacillus depressus TaxID=1602942 RepID=A0A6L3V994_9BACI|nr:VOC family protein [Cytobacillus depressus]KAB2334874.1 glyoxalase/bleomycin resistance/dioxygenase family protein [Cytobacillus depressus]